MTKGQWRLLRHQQFVLAVICCGVVSGHAHQPSIQLPEPDENGDYQWLYVDATGVTQQVVFVPRTKIDPGVSVELSWAGADFVFRYTVSNGSAARQRLNSLTLELSMPTTLVHAPPGWVVFRPSVVAPRAGWTMLGPA